MRLLDNLYAYVWQGKDNNCNSYLLADVLNNNKHLLVDPGHITTPFYWEAGLNRLFREIESDGVNAGQIGLVILTHCRPDHCEAASEIVKSASFITACCTI